MAGPVRQETIPNGSASARLAQLGAELLEQKADKQLYFLRPYGLYALVRQQGNGATWIGYFQDRSSCGC